ncbi:MAG TPA: ABC transporter permease [Jatrophihabitantaceae bacterium]|jgi:ribose transport system permease protein
MSTDVQTPAPDSADSVDGAPVDEVAVGSRLRRSLSLLGSLQGYVGLVLIILIGIITKGQTFWNQENLTNAIGGYAAPGILAVGETLVILTAGIDLSVGSMLGLGSMVSAMLLARHGMSPIEILPISMGVGALCGFANGIGTAWLRIQSFVVTLAMLNVIRGIDRQLSDNVSVGTQIVQSNGSLTANSKAFQAYGTPGHKLFSGINFPIFGHGIYYPVLALIVVVIVFQLLLSKSKLGRHIYAVGGNPTAARLSGINVMAVTITVFTLAGLLAGFAGPIDAAYNASADPLAGTSYELDAIAAVVIGGASLSGGRGTVVGTFVGVLILTFLDNVLGLNSISDNAQLIIKGLIVIAAVVIQRPDFFRSIVSALRRIRIPTRARQSTSTPEES